jgi:hypothetical protein
MLLGRYIQDQEPDACVIWIDYWKYGDVAECGGWFSYLRTIKGWVPDQETVFIFDEAQLSYEDPELWHDLFKNICDYPNRRAIVFASYGNPSSTIFIEGSPFCVNPIAKVSLLPIDPGDRLPAAGLLFNRAEFDELLSVRYTFSECPFDRSFLDSVFEITQGHVGAISSFLSIITGSDVCTLLTREAETYFISSFMVISETKTVDNGTPGNYFRKKPV